MTEKLSEWIINCPRLTNREEIAEKVVELEVKIGNEIESRDGWRDAWKKSETELDDTHKLLSACQDSHSERGNEIIELEKRIIDIEARATLGLKAYEHVRLIFYDDPVEVRKRFVELREKFGIE